MASVTGTQTNDSTKVKKVVLRGTAKLVAGDDVLSIDLPPEVEASAGRELSVTWTLVLKESE